MTAITTTAERRAEASLADEHSVLLWQACAYADDLAEAAQAGARLVAPYDAMLVFLHYRLLPYLADEELQLPPGLLRDEHMYRLLLLDHERLRNDIDNVEFSHTRELLALATNTLIDRLGRHAQREEVWATDSQHETTGDRLAAWALPLLLSDEIEVDVLPAEERDRLLCQRLAWMRPDDTVRLESAHDLHPTWRRLHRCDRDAHVWAYEESGPVRWRARISVRSRDE